VADSTLITMPFALADLPERTTALATACVRRNAGDASGEILEMLGLDQP
jgi:hypothetical protein